MTERAVSAIVGSDLERPAARGADQEDDLPLPHAAHSAWPGGVARGPLSDAYSQTPDSGWSPAAVAITPIAALQE